MTATSGSTDTKCMRQGKFLKGDFAQQAIGCLMSKGIEGERASELVLGIFRTVSVDNGGEESQDNSPFGLVRDNSERQALMSLIGINKSLSARELRRASSDTSYDVYDAPKSLRRRYSQTSLLYKAFDHAIRGVSPYYSMWTVDQAVNWTLDRLQNRESFQALATYSVGGCVVNTSSEYAIELEEKFWEYFDIDYRRYDDPESYVKGFPLLW